MIDFKKLHESGEINDYMFKMLDRSKTDLDLTTLRHAIQDACLATKLGVENDKDFETFHYIDSFMEDLVDGLFDTELSEQELEALKMDMFKRRGQIDFSNISAFFDHLMDWISHDKGIAKKAYPNQGTLYPQVARRDLARWEKVARWAYDQIRTGMLEVEVLGRACQYITETDKLDFKAWYRLKYGRLNNIYDVNQTIRRESEGTMNVRPKQISRLAFIHEDPQSYYLPNMRDGRNDQQRMEADAIDQADKQNRANNHTEARSKLVSRTFAIDKLLEKYHDILGEQSVSEIEDLLNTLRKRIRSLKLASIVRDTMIRTAATFRSKGFSIGAAELEVQAHKIFNESPIEKMAFDGSGPEVGQILAKLQQLSNDIKRRDMVKEIAKIDIQLHDMNAYALFPELAEAQAKLIDATAYASNKLEDVIPKLRSLQQGKTPEELSRPKGEPAPEAPAPKAAPAPMPEQAPKPVAVPAPEAPPKPAIPTPAPVAAPAKPAANLENSI